MIITNSPIKHTICERTLYTSQPWIRWFNLIQRALNGLQNENGGIIPAVMADADAANNTIYYSLDSGKLTYSDLTGTKHALY